MKTAVSAGYWSAGPPPGAAELFETAERAGIDQIWTAEAYGSDAWTPLAWWGSRTSRIQLGTAVSQLSARPPVGPWAKITDEIQRWTQTVLTTFTLNCDPRLLAKVIELVR